MLNRQVILYISNSYQKVLLSIDTGFFTASSSLITAPLPLNELFHWVLYIKNVCIKNRQIYLINIIYLPI